MANNRPVVFVVLLLFVSWGQAKPVQGTGNFVCQPDSFNAAVERKQLHLDGELRVPTPGYSYRLSQGNRSGKTHQFHVVLYPPKGPAPTVIDSLRIEGEFEVAAPIRKIQVAVEKDFNWGPDRIVCEREEKEGK